MRHFIASFMLSALTLGHAQACSTETDPSHTRRVRVTPIFGAIPEEPIDIDLPADALNSDLLQRLDAHFGITGGYLSDCAMPENAESPLSEDALQYSSRPLVMCIIKPADRHERTAIYIPNHLTYGDVITAVEAKIGLKGAGLAVAGRRLDLASTVDPGIHEAIHYIPLRTPPVVAPTMPAESQAPVLASSEAQESQARRVTVTPILGAVPGEAIAIDLPAGASYHDLLQTVEAHLGSTGGLLSHSSYALRPDLPLKNKNLQYSLLPLVGITFKFMDHHKSMIVCLPQNMTYGDIITAIAAQTGIKGGKLLCSGTLLDPASPIMSYQKTVFHCIPSRDPSAS